MAPCPWSAFEPGTISFCLAFLIWNLDKWKALGDPHSHSITGHAVSHVLAAATIYRFFRHQDELVS